MAACSWLGVALLILVVFAFASGTLFPASETAARESHQRMLKALRELADRSDADHPYLNRTPVEALRTEVRALTSATPVQERARLHVNLGQGELRLGNLSAAVQQLETGYRLLDEFPPEVRDSAQQSLAYHLGLAYMRLGETENCVQHHRAASCLLPIAPEAVHTAQRGSRSAMPYFRRVMELSEPDSAAHLSARWLLNLAAMTLGEYPDGLKQAERIPPETFASDEPFPRFANIAGELGLAIVDTSGGAIVEDFNGDGLLDLITSPWHTRGQIRYFERGRAGDFRERTAAANLSGITGGLNLVPADYDNDGDVDILVLRGAWVYGESGRHPNSLLRNQGDGVFLDVTYLAGLASENYPTQAAAWADYDNDGDLDLYVGNEASPQQRFPGQLFRNDGDGAFTDVAAEAGVENLRYAKGVAWGDFNQDRNPDLYVSNLGGRNRLYRNNGDGTFTDVAPLLGVTGPRDSLPAWFWDFDNDGKLDLFVASYFQSVPPDRLAAVVASHLGRPHRGEPHHLYQWDGTRFHNVAPRQNLNRLTLTMGSNFGDLDNDGYLDFYLGTGYPFYDGLIPNVLYHNQRGEGFAEVASAAGMAHLQKGHAVVFADLDNDGDQDVFEQMGGAYPSEAYANSLYENPGFNGNWLKVKLVGKESNRSALGARIHARFTEDGVQRSVYRWVGTGGSFAANPLTQHLGVGRASRIDRLEVYWPTSDRTQQFEDLEANQSILIREGEKEFEAVPHPPLPFKRTLPGSSSPSHGVSSEEKKE